MVGSPLAAPESESIPGVAAASPSCIAMEAYASSREATGGPIRSLRTIP